MHHRAALRLCGQTPAGMPAGSRIVRTRCRYAHSTNAWIARTYCKYGPLWMQSIKTLRTASRHETVDPSKPREKPGDSRKMQVSELQTPRAQTAWPDSDWPHQRGNQGLPFREAWQDAQRLLRPTSVITVTSDHGGGGGGGGRHLVTVPQGVVGGRLPWDGEGRGGGGRTAQ